MTRGTCSIEWLTTWDEVWSPAFLEQWRRCLAATPNHNIFFHPAVVRAWVEWVGSEEDVQPRFAVGTSASGPMLLPMVRIRRSWKRGWLREWTTTGCGTYDYHDPLAPDAESRRLLLAAVHAELHASWRSDWDVFRVPGVHDEFVLPGLACTRKEVPAPYLDMSRYASYEHYLSTLSTGCRTDIRRKSRRAQALRDFAFVHASASEPALTDSMLLALSRYHAARWGYGGDSRQVGRRLQLWTALARHALGEGVLHLSCIRAEGEWLAGALGFVANSTYYYYVPALDERRQICSPGTVHLACLLDWSFANHMQCFDFLTGAEEYKYHWTATEATLCSLRSQSCRVASRVRCRLDLALSQLRHLVKRH